MLDEYSPREFIESLTRAFSGPDAADYVIYDGQVARNRFLRECLQWALGKDLIYEDNNTSEMISDSQYTAQAFRLTDLGRRVVLEPEAPPSLLDEILDQTPARP